MTFPVEKFISNFIKKQLPSFYETEGENFTLFLQAYYEWLENNYTLVEIKPAAAFEVGDTVTGNTIGNQGIITYVGNTQFSQQPNHVSIDHLSKSVVGFDTKFSNTFLVGDTIKIGDNIRKVVSVEDDEHLTVDNVFSLPSVRMDGTINIQAGSDLVFGTNTEFTNNFNIGDTLIINGSVRKIRLISNNLRINVDIPLETTANNISFDIVPMHLLRHLDYFKSVSTVLHIKDNKFVEGESITNQQGITSVISKASSGSVIHESRSLFEYRDIDFRLEDFLEYFQKKYLYGIPYNIISNKKLLLKHILDIYRSKGSVRGWELLFKLIYNQDIEVYFPGRDILKSSDGTWVEPRYLEVTYNKYLDDIRGKEIIGSVSGTIATVETFITEPINKNIVSNLYISNIYPQGGEFVIGEKLLDYQNPAAYSLVDAPQVIGSLAELEIINGGNGFTPGDILAIVEKDENGNPVSMGARGRLRISETSRSQGALFFYIGEFGSGYTSNASIYFYKEFGDNSGHDASFGLGPLSFTRRLTYNEDIIYNYKDTYLNSIRFDFPENPAANIEYEIQQTLNYTNNIFGSVYNLSDVKSGNNYIAQPEISIRSSIVSKPILKTKIEVTANSGYGVNPDDNVIYIANANHYFTTNSQVVYVVPPGSQSSITPMTNNSPYYVSFANNSAIALSATKGGANLNITFSNTTANGETHFLFVETKIYYPNDNIFVLHLGEISYNINSNTITGTATNFADLFSNGDIIGIKHTKTSPDVDQYFEIYNVANNTSMVLTHRPSTNSTAYSKFYKVPYIKGTGTSFDDLFVNNDIIGLKADKQDASTQEFHKIRTVVNNSVIILYGSPLYEATTTAQHELAPSIMRAQFALYEPVMYTVDGTVPGENSVIGALPNNGNNIVSKAVAYDSGKGYVEGQIVDAYLTDVLTNPIILKGGSGYSNNDELMFSGGTSSVQGNGFITTDSTGKIVGTTLVNPGANYFAEPVVLVNSNTGSGAVLKTSIAPPDVYNTFSVVTGRIRKSGVGKSPGHWTTSRGFLNSDKYIQDSSYYQDYSYEIRVANTLDKYKSVIYDTFHNTGMELFGKYLSFDYQESEANIAFESIKPIYGLLTIDRDIDIENGILISIPTADNETFTADNTYG